MKHSAISPAEITGFATRSVKKGKTVWASEKDQIKRGHAIAGVATRTELLNGKFISGWLPLPIQKLEKENLL